MADLTVSSPVDSFMQSTSEAQMRERIGFDDDFINPASLGNDLIRRMVSRVLSDGTTTSRARILTPGAIGAVAGLPITIEAEFVVPTSTPSTYANIAILSDSVSAGDLSDDTRTNTMWVQLKTALRLKITGAAASSYRIFSDASFRADYSGQTVKMAVVFTEGDSTNDPTITVNGVDVSGNFSLATNGTIPNWMDASLLEDTYLLDGYNWPSGDSPTARVIIGAYSDAEAVTWTAGGQRPDWAELAGSAVPIKAVTDRNGDFETTGGGAYGCPFEWWASLNSGAGLYAVAETTDVYAGTTSCRITGGGTLGSSGNNWLRRLNSTTGVSLVYNLVAGNDYVMSFAAKYVSGGSFYFGESYNTIRTITSAEATDWTVFTVKWTCRYGNNAPIFGAASGAVWLLDAVSEISSGLIDNPIPQPGLTSFDALGRMSRRNVGHINVSDRDRSRFSSAYDYDATSIRLGGGEILDGNAYRIVSVTGNSVNAVDLALGPTSGTDSIISATSVNGNFDISTFATRITTGASLWLTSSGATSGNIKITYERL
jgi:hypothetical protein